MSRLPETIPHGKCTEISSRKSSPVQITNLQHMWQGGVENEEPHSHDTQWREKISYVCSSYVFTNPEFSICYCVFGKKLSIQLK